MDRSAGAQARSGRARGENGSALADGPTREDELALADGPARENGSALADGPTREDELALGVAAGIERLLTLLRSLAPRDGLSFTAAATLATLDRSGPSRLTLLAVNEGVTQPAMTQLVARLQDAGLVARASDPSDRRVVEVSITAEGSALLSRRRAVRAGRLAGMLARLSPEDQAALAAALPAMDALTSQREPNVAERSNR
ncbi:MAG TPA: MarR family transcriptional regulator [Streptosporangiaceae bacterium]|jgi:DNA-binding MarR family transcriptional regulator